MAKYKFIKEWSTSINAAFSGVGESGVDMVTLQYKVGDVVYGQEYPEGQSLSTMPRPNIFINIPYSVLQKVDNSSGSEFNPFPNNGLSKNENLWTPKSVLIILTAIAAFIIIIRHFSK